MASTTPRVVKYSIKIATIDSRRLKSLTEAQQFGSRLLRRFIRPGAERSQSTMVDVRVRTTLEVFATIASCRSQQ